jgi:glycoside/pentoside/hexuronide:cation symporter, GPH family
MPEARLPTRTKFSWALGSLGDNYAGNTIHQLRDAVYIVGHGVPPELIGWAISLPRVLDALLDPLLGYWSDQARTRWGRRRPFILGGALALGLAMMLLWLPPADTGWSHRTLAVYFLGASLLYYAAYSIFLVPYRALGLELTSDYHERTRLQAWGMMIGLIGGLGIPWLYKLALVFGGATGGGTAAPDAIINGARWVGIAVGLLILVSCALPAIFCRETPGPAATTARLSLGRALAATLRNRPFLHMLGMNFCAILAMFAPVTAALLVNIYYLFAGDQQAAATLVGYLGMAQMFGSLAGVPVNTALSGQLGKRAAALIALAVAATGYASLWWTLLPAHPYWALGSQFLIGWGMQGVWLMSATMNADVCDNDELTTGHRRQGLYGAVFALEQKIAFACAALLGSYLVARCGYLAGTTPDLTTLVPLRTALVIAPLAALTLATAAIATYPLTRSRVAAIQAQLATRI